MKKIYLIIGAMAVAGSAMASDYNGTIYTHKDRSFDSGASRSGVTLKSNINVTEEVVVSPTVGIRIDKDADSDAFGSKGQRLGQYVSSHKLNAKAEDYHGNSATRLNFGLGVQYTQADTLAVKFGVTFQSRSDAFTSDSYDTKAATKKADREVNAYDKLQNYVLTLDTTYSMGVNKFWFGADVYSTDTNGVKDNKESGQESNDYVGSATWGTKIAGQGDDLFSDAEEGKSMALGLGYTFADEANSGLTAGVKVERFAFAAKDNDSVVKDGNFVNGFGDDTEYRVGTYDKKGNLEYKDPAFILAETNVAFKVSDAVTPYAVLGYATSAAKWGDDRKNADPRQFNDKMLSTDAMMTIVVGVKGSY